MSKQPEVTGESPLPLIVIVGPTATGKSDLAVSVAQALGGPEHAEIINADAYQLYAGMDIGTAKITSEEQRGIRHHLLDILDISEDTSVAHYQTLAYQAMADINSRGRRAILVGGSGLYIRAATDDMQFPGTDPAVRTALEDEERLHGTAPLAQRLSELDPDAAERIGPHNTRRIIRALEVITLTGKPFTAFLPRATAVRPTVTLGLDCHRETLDQRITLRSDTMRERGLVQEVATLAERGFGRTASRAVGYAEILRHLAGEITQDQAFTDIVTNTRRLTRKQMGWFGRDSRTTWCNALSPTLLDDALAAITAADHGAITPHDSTQTRRSLGS
ncbi:tRNA (adenosine(37)-N6)-dimethylallyltransferase MiaA [Jonesia quinghaiensis]|uniref:tRNA (adenosine(37)-N6)-dimethylallyltransferase MiaA n=1 Tax=Jonesia quinghaiensis TaxID=262806 RepID=UPI00040C8820|nr:tRNA (adenosine(37)-N6)-dimethylallyltransferase MiaA [Jonesia quinghaiensis]